MIRSLSASANGEMLYFCAVGSVWAVQASGGETRAVTAGEYAVVLRPISKSKKFSGGDVARAQGDGMVFDSVWSFQIPQGAKSGQ